MTSGLQAKALAKHADTNTHQTRDDYPEMHMGKHAVQTINKHTLLIISHK